jgi:hypothetical protein
MCSLVVALVATTVGDSRFLDMFLNSAAVFRAIVFLLVIEHGLDALLAVTRLPFHELRAVAKQWVFLHEFDVHSYLTS